MAKTIRDPIPNTGMEYCPRCQMGRLGEDGNCPLCGAMALPASGLRAVAARAAASLAGLVAEPPAVLTTAIGIAALLALVSLVVVLPRTLPVDASGRLFNPFSAVPGPLAKPSPPANPAVGLLWFGISQAFLFALVLLTLLWLHARSQRRRRARDKEPSAVSEADRPRSALPI